MDKAVAAALASPPTGPVFTVPPNHDPPRSSHWLAPIFKIVDGEFVKTGAHQVEYSNPARRMYEKDKAARDAFLKELWPDPQPRAICKTIYRVKAACGLPVDSCVCGQCEEAWEAKDLLKALEHEFDGLCVKVAAQYRSAMAQMFYEWCRANNYLDCATKQ